MADKLEELKSSLLHRLRFPTPLGPDEGDAAFDQHVLLATKIHRAALLQPDRGTAGKARGRIQFLSAYFPAGRNGEGDAQLPVGRLANRTREGSCTGGRGQHHPRTPGAALEARWLRGALHRPRVDVGRLRVLRQPVCRSTRGKQTTRQDRRRSVSGKTWTVRPFMLLPQTLGARPVEGYDAPARGRRHSVEPTTEDLVAGRSRSRSRSAASG